MQDFMRRYETFANGHGWRTSVKHKIIIREVFNLHAHFTEKDLAEHASLSKISAKTRNQVLARLVTSGLIRKMFFGEKSIFYEHVYGHVHHDHLVCVHCGSIIEFQDEKIEQRQKAVCQKHAFRMIKHSMHILGECGACQKKNAGHVLNVPGEKTGAEHKTDHVPLSTVPSGKCVTIVRINGGTSLQHRLSEMGLVPGTQIRVVSNLFSGPFIIQIQAGRLAIGHQITHKVMVRDSDCKEKNV
ncbi:FeoA domain-containing protein [bacterium]|nr:FeoA domain-containing protein [bacterium]